MHKNILNHRRFPFAAIFGNAGPASTIGFTQFALTALARVVDLRLNTPRYIVISGSVSRSRFGSGISVIVASVSSKTPATETAFSSAVRTTFAPGGAPVRRDFPRGP